MPAKRTRGSRGTAEYTLVCSPSIPTQPAQSGIAFAPNVTPGTYNDPPPMIFEGLPTQTILFPPTDDYGIKRRAGHGKKKPDHHIPRPPNAFILFRSSFIKSQHVSTEVETNHSTLSKIIGLTWQNLPNEERQVWHAKAKAAQDEHKRKFPQYAFRPLQNKGPTEKRKVREVGIKDHKRCAKIAELLVEGKKGHELDAAIQEFDKHHVPEVVTRFEAPITARTYRRSSSAPIPESEESKRPFLSCSSVPLFKPRSSSSKPAICPQPIALQNPFSLSVITDPLPLTPTTASASPQDFSLDSLYATSFDQNSMHPDIKPSFDFDTFSFNNVAPFTPFSCDSLTQSVDPLTTFCETPSEPNHPALSIDTSFLNLEDWTRCSSPVTPASSMPATPGSYGDSPSPGPFNSFSLGGSPEYHPMTNSFDDLANYPLYADDGSLHFPGNEKYPSLPSDFSFDAHAPVVHTATSDLDFSALVDSLPQYAF